jgi:HlyD family secretion protein
MQILASVGEGDIAQIKEGQKVKFSVQALSGQTFEGNVAQVRLQSVTNENVVNYTVVVAVANPEKKLLPGMTARVEFLTNSADDVLKVANAALRFKPADDVVVAKTETAAGTPPAQPAGRRRSGARANGGKLGTVYTIDEKGTLTPIRVRTGLTDGSTTEVRGRDLKEGMKVVAGTAQAQSANTTSNASPFQNNQPQQRGPRPGGF